MNRIHEDIVAACLYIITGHGYPPKAGDSLEYAKHARAFADQKNLLEEGRNHILIKVEQWKAGWGLSFRLKDLEVRNHKQKYYIQ